MGSLSSLSEEIGRIRFVRFPTRPTKACERVVRVDGMILAKMGERTVACSRDITKFIYPQKTRGQVWMETVIDGLHRLGMISAKAMDEHLNICRENDAKDARRYATDRLREAARELGIALTDKQAKQLNGAALR